MSSDDPMWSEFRPLWTALPFSGNQVQLAGGYGLFLKERWLLANRGKPIIIPMEKWRQTGPRATRDLDILIGLELLASAEAQKSIINAMEQNQFSVVEKNARWQFQKRSGAGEILVDLHAEIPEYENPNLAQDRVRIKHKPSLANEGVHGRQNLEAAGCGLHPFLFEIDSITISVPNPITWSMMKLISASDRRAKSLEKERDEDYREFHRHQAEKHARDVARVVAMTTRDERDRAPEVVAKIREKACFFQAVEVCDRLFARENAWGSRIAAPAWQDVDLKVIRDTLSSWFRLGT